MTDHALSRIPAFFAQRIQQAAAAGKLTPNSVQQIAAWLTDERYASTRQVLQNLISQGRWAELDAAFWTVIPFGTAGRRGMMFPVGPNAINDRTMGESARGVADYLSELYASELAAGQLRVAIGYDTRHRSRHFAELCAEILTAVGIRVMFLDGHRATPELAMTVRHYQCQAGIMISASHNPPSDNAIKVFWNDGAQVRPPFDAALIERVNRVTSIPRLNFKQAIEQTLVQFVEREMDQVYQTAVLKLSQPGSRNLRILYSPLHGVGRTSVEPVLYQAGFSQIEVYGPQAEPDGDFPNVPQHVANPENPAVFDDLISATKQSNCDIALASDPDADRIGVACQRSLKTPNEWVFITGNQIGVLMGACLLERVKKRGQLTSEHFVVKTLVTSNMLCRVAEHYGCQAFGDVLTGFKWIGLEIDRHGPDKFVMGTEEAHGYLAGTHIRDKDAAVAALILAEYAAELKQAGRTLYEELLRLYEVVGCHQEAAFALTLPGANGMQVMQQVLQKMRQAPPTKLAGATVTQLRDYQTQTVRQLKTGATTPLHGPQAEMMFLDLDRNGDQIAIRPSGTEPKLKFYLMSSLPVSNSSPAAQAVTQLQAYLGQIRRELEEWIEKARAES